MVTSLAATQEQSIASVRLLKSEDLPNAVEADALQRQYDALAAIAPTKIKYAGRGPVAVVRTSGTGPVLPARVRDLEKGNEVANIILPVVGDLLLARGNESLTVTVSGATGPSTRTLRLEENIRGIPVVSSLVAIDYDESTLRIEVLAANFVPDRNLPSEPKISATDAERLVPQALQTAESMRKAEIEIEEGTFLAYYASPIDAEAPQLVWVVQVSIDQTYDQFLVDALTGSMVGRIPQSFSITSTFYNANGGNPSIPGGLPNPMSPSAVQNLVDARNVRDNLVATETAVIQQFPYSGIVRPNSVSVVVKNIWPATTPPRYRAQSFKKNSVNYMQYSPATTGVNWWGKPLDVVAHEYGHLMAGVVPGTLGANNMGGTEQGALHEFYGDFIATAVDATTRGWSSDLT